MKLIDILVQELPKHGGWPEGAVECCRFVDEANIDFYYASGNWPIDCGEKYGAIALNAVRKQTIPCESEKVTFEQYEAALASCQPQWNGEGLPPVGALCQYQDYSDTPWVECKVLAYHNNECWLQRTADGTSFIMGNPHLHPIRSEADQKRKESTGIIADICRSSASNGHSAELIYDAIAAGKIPHIQLK